MLTEVKTKRARSSNSFVSVIISWLGVWFVVQPSLQEKKRVILGKAFENDLSILEQSIIDIQQLLDEFDCVE